MFLCDLRSNLFHASATLKEWNGELLIESAVGEGTLVKIVLVRTRAPEWFVPDIRISEERKIVILDDDESIHQVWKAKFIQANISKERVKHFSNEQDFRKWIVDCKNVDECLFLCDYELLGTKTTGLDLIQEYGLQSQSILVTSRYEEAQVFSRAKKLGLKMMPKSLAHLVLVLPLIKKQVAEKSDIDAVIIDDDLIIHQIFSKLLIKMFGFDLMVVNFS